MEIRSFFVGVIIRMFVNPVSVDMFFYIYVRRLWKLSESVRATKRIRFIFIYFQYNINISNALHLSFRTFKCVKLSRNMAKG